MYNAPLYNVMAEVISIMLLLREFTGRRIHVVGENSLESTGLLALVFPRRAAALRIRPRGLSRCGSTQGKEHWSHSKRPYIMRPYIQCALI